MDLALNFPDDSAGLFHVIHAEAIVANPDLLHHYVVRGCADPWPEETVGKEIDRGNSCSGYFPQQYSLQQYSLQQDCLSLYLLQSSADTAPSFYS